MGFFPAGETLLLEQNKFKIRISELEDGILQRLASAEGDLTENLALIESLEESKVTTPASNPSPHPSPQPPPRAHPFTANPYCTPYPTCNPRSLPPPRVAPT